MKILFDLEEFNVDTSKKTFQFKDQQLSISILESLLSCIAIKYLYNKRHKTNKDHTKRYPVELTEGVNIPVTEFKNISSNNYKIYLDFMVDKRWININNKYIVGKKSRTYYFTDYFKMIANISDVIFDQDIKYNRKITRNSIIDKEVLRKIECDYKSIVVTKYNVPKKDRAVQFTDFRNYIQNMIQLYKLGKRRGYFKMCYPNNRISTTFTSLPENVRSKNITFTGDKLAKRDIPSSFPLFLSIWLTKNGLSGKEPEIIDFVKGLDKGTFYYKICDRMNKATGNTINEKYTKADAKTHFQIWLNDFNTKKDGSLRKDIINQVISKYYPKIMEVMIAHKEQKNSIYYILEKMESWFIFNKVCKRLYNEIPGIQLLTCHDSVYFEKRFEAQVERIWGQEIQYLYNNFCLPYYSSFNDTGFHVVGHENDIAPEVSVDSSTYNAADDDDDFFGNNTNPVDKKSTQNKLVEIKDDLEDPFSVTKKRKDVPQDPFMDEDDEYEDFFR